MELLWIMAPNQIQNISNILPYLKELNKIKFYIQADNFINNPLLYKIAKDSKNIELIYGNKNIHSNFRLILCKRRI